MATTTAQAERTAGRVLLGILKSLRPKQISKNALVLVPLFFTVTQWWAPDDVTGMAQLVGRSFGALAIFTLISGAIYLLNDVFDVEADRAHPRKRHRPIASGVLPVGLAVGVAGVLGLGGIAVAFLLSSEFGYVAIAYAGLMQAYNVFLKSQVILDVMAIAGGFVLRAVAGAVAIDHSEIEGIELDLTISPWLYICTALGALFIALAKRRGELVEAGDRAQQQRGALAHYTLPYLDMLIATVAPATLVAYSLYTFSGGFFGSLNIPENNSMMLTIPFVAYGLFRYLYLIHVKSLGEAPDEVLLTDRPLLLDIVIWLFVSAAILLVND